MASPSLPDLVQAYLDRGHLSPIYLASGEGLDIEANLRAFAASVDEAAKRIGYDPEAAQRDMQALWDLDSCDNVDLRSLDVEHLQALRVFAVHDAATMFGMESTAAACLVDDIDAALTVVKHAT